MSPKSPELIVATTSKFRLQLLVDAQIPFRSMAPTTDEADIRSETPMELAMLRAIAKAESLVDRERQAHILGCDQVLECEGQSFGKARDRSEAKERLGFFSGKTHLLHSAFAIVQWHQQSRGGQIEHQQIVTAEMKMRELTDQEIDDYLDTDEWIGCAGCYQYENQGGGLFSHVSGELSTIIGLPVLELRGALRRLGF